ncbi:nuclease I [Gigaspora margarita]|uniref:Nuclease I n=2 Tax=Gigaspora margarita TaxID=4874 RepID=A0A8H4AL25_GIGMA|nr:nuclease I [Gigaspora margarita]
MFQKKRIVFFALIFFIPYVLSWGFVGHQIAAAIGQRFLFPDVYRKVVELLPKAAHGNLSYIAAWADQIKHKNEYRFTSPMHYTNPTPLIDNPPSHCGFDWNPGKIDLITAIHNYTKRLDPESDLNFWSRAEALRFLVHFIGDLHQPLHLTGKAKGGNGLHAIFEGHKTSVHYVWDSSILYKRIREFNENSTFDPNFTEDDSRFNSSDPLSGGPFYDLYLNYIINLMLTTWRKELASWTICDEDFKLSSDLPLSSPNQLYFSSTNESSDHLSLLMNQKISFSTACPEFWAAPINKLNCQVTLNGYDPNLDLSIGEYYERIVNGKVIEKLLAISGFRIAAILNTILK